MPANNTPRIVNIADFMPRSKNVSMIHLNKSQWAKVSKSLKTVKTNALPKYGMKIELIPDPNSGVIVYPQCDSSPDNICSVVNKWSPNGITMECRCRPKKPGGSPGGVTNSPPAKKKCTLILSNSTLRCISLSNPPCTDCKLKIVTFGGRTMLFCSCG